MLGKVKGKLDVFVEGDIEVGWLTIEHQLGSLAFSIHHVTTRVPTPYTYSRMPPMGTKSAFGMARDPSQFVWLWAHHASTRL